MAKNPWISRGRGVDYRRFVMQKPLIEKHFPCFMCRLSHRHLECEGFITPSEDCATYRVAISYEQDGCPRVKIKDPQITPSSAIHMYRNGDLCLYEPAENPWKSSDNIHEKIVPWIAEWLVFYELYLMCGTWLGPEAPHSVAGRCNKGTAIEWRDATEVSRFTCTGSVSRQEARRALFIVECEKNSFAGDLTSAFRQHGLDRNMRFT